MKMAIEYAIKRKDKEYFHQETIFFNFNNYTEKMFWKSWKRLQDRVKWDHGNSAHLVRIVSKFY